MIESLEDRLLLSTDVVTAAGSATASFSPQAQAVSLNATVTDPNNSGDVVNEGDVSFTLVDGSGNTVGNAISAPVSNGTATASYNLPAGQAAGRYSIDGSYSDSANQFTDIGDTTGTLSVSPAGVATAAQTASAAFSTQSQNVSLSATLTDLTKPGDTINQGTVTFTLVDSNGNTVGHPVSAAVSNGSATVNYNLPAGQTAGSYTMDVRYSDAAGDVTDSGDTSSTLTVSAANVTTTAQAGSFVYGTANQPITLQATISDTTHPGDTINEGTVTFTVVDSNGNTIGSSVTAAVVNGQATASFRPLANLPPGSYTLHVSYNDPQGDFTDVSDTPSTLTLNFTPSTQLLHFPSSHPDFRPYLSLEMGRLSGQGEGL
jgi:hypothetical protein